MSVEQRLDQWDVSRHRSQHWRSSKSLRINGYYCGFL